MATSSHAKTLLGGLAAEFKRSLGEVLDYVFNGNLAFGPIDSDAAQTKTTNLAGRYVKVTTSATANQEVAVAHGLARIPNVIWQVTSPRVVNSRFLGDLTIARAADERRVYLTSGSTGAVIWLYLE
jgi:hypothetical protein